MGRGKHFIGDFLPPDELEKFMETFKALKVDRAGPQAPVPAVGLSSMQPAQCSQPFLLPPYVAGACSGLRAPLAHRRSWALLPQETSAYDRCHLYRELANSSSAATLETFPRA